MFPVVVAEDDVPDASTQHVHDLTRGGSYYLTLFMALILICNDSLSK